MLQRFRILPLLILVSVAMFTLKLGTIWQDIIDLNTSMKSRAALAAEAGAKTEAKTPETAKNGGPAASAKAPAAKPDSAGEMPTAAPPGGDGSFDPRDLSQSEVRLLQALSERRKELDVREGSLNQREALLKAAEQQLVDKQADFVAMRAEVKGLLGQLDEQEKKRINNLVKLYETMKPKDAAKILNDLELSVLLGVVERMNVRRLAPVLADMDPEKARAITRALATREKAQKSLSERMKDSIAERK
jgi:flagellar motility protein MotE (MotC chaperone)